MSRIPQCPQCGYDWSGLLVARCPECGLDVFAAESVMARKPRRARVVQVVLVELPLAAAIISVCAWSLASYLSTGTLPFQINFNRAAMSRPDPYSAGWIDSVLVAAFGLLVADAAIQRVLFLLGRDRERRAGYISGRLLDRLRNRARS